MRHALTISFASSLVLSLHAATESPVPLPEPSVEVRRAIVAPDAPAAAASAAAPASAPAASSASGGVTSGSVPKAAMPAVAPATPGAAAAQPGEAPPQEKPAEPKLVYVRCEVQQPAIAITFDDGPHPEFTPRLLDTLKKENIKATFFLVGKCVVTYPDIVKRMVDEGHEVASHSWSHPLLTSLSQAGVDTQMRKTHDAIIKACGITPTLYRPPYGASRLSQRKRIHEEFGYASILWDVDPLDWQRPRTSQKVHDRVLAQVRPGSIILCHDIHETTVDAMPGTLAELKARGYQFMTVSELIDLEAKTPRTPGVPIAAAPLPAVLPLSATEPETPPQGQGQDKAPMPAAAAPGPKEEERRAQPVGQPQSQSQTGVAPAQPVVKPAKPVKLKPNERLSLDLPGEAKP